MRECEPAELQSVDIDRGDRRPGGRLATELQVHEEEGVINY